MDEESQVYFPPFGELMKNKTKVFGFGTNEMTNAERTAAVYSAADLTDAAVADKNVYDQSPIGGRMKEVDHLVTKPYRNSLDNGFDVPPQSSILEGVSVPAMKTNVVFDTMQKMNIEAERYRIPAAKIFQIMQPNGMMGDGMEEKLDIIDEIEKFEWKSDFGSHPIPKMDQSYNVPNYTLDEFAIDEKNQEATGASFPSDGEMMDYFGANDTMKWDVNRPYGPQSPLQFPEGINSLNNVLPKSSNHLSPVNFEELLAREEDVSTTMGGVDASGLERLNQVDTVSEEIFANNQPFNIPGINVSLFKTVHFEDSEHNPKVQMANVNDLPDHEDQPTFEDIFAEDVNTNLKAQMNIGFEAKTESEIRFEPEVVEVPQSRSASNFNKPMTLEPSPPMPQELLQHQMYLNSNMQHTSSATTQATSPRPMNPLKKILLSMLLSEAEQCAGLMQYIHAIEASEVKETMNELLEFISLNPLKEGICVYGLKLLLACHPDEFRDSFSPSAIPKLFPEDGDADIGGDFLRSYLTYKEKFQGKKDFKHSCRAEAHSLLSLCLKQSGLKDPAKLRKSRLRDWLCSIWSHINASKPVGPYMCYLLLSWISNFEDSLQDKQEVFLLLLHERQIGHITDIMLLQCLLDRMSRDDTICHTHLQFTIFFFEPTTLIQLFKKFFSHQRFTASTFMYHWLRLTSFFTHAEVIPSYLEGLAEKFDNTGRYWYFFLGHYLEAGRTTQFYSGSGAPANSTNEMSIRVVESCLRVAFAYASAPLNARDGLELALYLLVKGCFPLSVCTPDSVIAPFLPFLQKFKYLWNISGTATDDILQPLEELISFCLLSSERKKQNILLQQAAAASETIGKAALAKKEIHKPGFAHNDGSNVLPGVARFFNMNNGANMNRTMMPQYPMNVGVPEQNKTLPQREWSMYNGLPSNGMPYPVTDRTTQASMPYPGYGNNLAVLAKDVIPPNFQDYRKSMQMMMPPALTHQQPGTLNMQMHTPVDFTTHAPALALQPVSTNFQTATRGAKPHSRKVGLQNKGNTCFLNSSVQALFLTDAFFGRLLKWSDSGSRPEKHKINFEVLNALKKLFLRMLTTKSTSIDPSNFLMTLPHQFNCGRQQDASEFLRFLYEELGTHEGKLLREVFSGVTVQKVECQRCHVVSERKEIINDFSFAVRPDESGSKSLKSGLSVEKFFEAYTKVEKLSGDNKYLCSRCGKKQTAKKWDEIYSPPSHIMVTLNRFLWTNSRNQKVTTYVKINETLTIWGLPYKLYAVIFHAGQTADSGHYYCIGHDSEDSEAEWMEFNDSFIKKSTFEKINEISTNALSDDSSYIVFYRCLRAPSTPSIG